MINFIWSNGKKKECSIFSFLISFHSKDQRNCVGVPRLTGGKWAVSSCGATKTFFCERQEGRVLLRNFKVSGIAGVGGGAHAPGATVGGSAEIDLILKKYRATFTIFTHLCQREANFR